MIELRALGTAEIRTEMATLTPSQGIVFAVALYLTVQRVRPLGRSQIAELIWPGIPHPSRAHRLRQSILQLKKLGFRVCATRDTLIVDCEVVSDAERVPKGVWAADEPTSLAFLPGYNPTFSRPYGDWLDAIRNEFQSAAVEALVHAISIRRNRGDWQSVDRMASKCLSLDAFNEEAVLAKAEAAAMRGSKRKAVAMLDEYLSEIGESSRELKLSATVLRRRVVERVPDRPALLDGDPAFVGREEEMAVLTRALGEARANQGSAVLVMGEPGIGKTRLSAELARFAELRGVRVQRATCRRADIERPLSVFVDVVPQLRDLPGALGCSPETFSWLKRLTEFEQRSEESSRPLDTEKLFECICAALFDLLESIADEHCLLVVIEDVQWLDKASTTLLIRMAQWCRTRRILFVLNARPGQNSVVEYDNTVDLKRIVLGPLVASAAMALLKSLAFRPGDEPEPAFLDWCLAVAEGNPFFLQELAHQWIETGLRSEAPPSISRVLDERLSRLTPEALHVLQTGALLNDFATIDRVERVLGYPPHRFLVAVEELSKAAMLQSMVEHPDSGGSQIRPKHDFLASAAVSRLSSVSRAFLHRRCANALETDLVQQTVSASLLWTCATHRYHAGDRERALTLRISCADHLLEMGLAHDACITSRQTLNYCCTDTERLKVLSHLARALELDGHWNESIEALRECILLDRKISSTDTEHNDFELLMLEARHRSMLDFTLLLDETLSCVKSEKASPKHKVGAAVLAMKVAVDFGRADLLDAIYVEVSPQFGDPSVGHLRCLELKTIYGTMRGDQVVPLTDLERLVQVARNVDGELGYIRALVMAGTACRLSARYQEGLEFANRALEHAKANRFHSKHREILLWTIALHIAARKFGEARNALNELLNDPFPSDSVKERNEAYLLDARIAIEERDFPRAEWAFAQAEPISPTYSHARKCYSLALEVRIRLNQGATNEVLRPLVNELELMNRQLLAIATQDFETYTLFLGLTALGNEQRGIDILREYIDTRRVKWPLSLEIREALAFRALPTTALAAP